MPSDYSMISDCDSVFEVRDGSSQQKSRLLTGEHLVVAVVLPAPDGHHGLDQALDVLMEDRTLKHNGVQHTEVVESCLQHHVIALIVPQRCRSP